MNTIFTHVQNENQQRLFEALRRISEESDEHGGSKPFPPHMLDNSALYSEEFLLSDSGFVSPISKDDNSDITGMALDFQDTPDTSLSFDPLCAASYDERLQVDRNGTKVAEDVTATAILPMSLLSDLSGSIGMYTSSPIPCPQDAPANAAVFAAAMTAAMIMERADASGKRPRSMSPETADDDYLGDNDTDENDMEETYDIITESSSDNSETTFHMSADSSVVGGSPRSVLPTRKTPHEVPSPLARNGRYNQQTSRPTTGRMSLTGTFQRNSSRAPVRRGGTSPRVPDVQEMKACSSGNVDSSPSAILSRKRRAEAMERFRRKKAVRCYGRRVRYQIRKRIATTRPRVNGRFARRADAESKAASTAARQ